jgi:hypothetical protein
VTEYVVPTDPLCVAESVIAAWTDADRLADTDPLADHEPAPTPTFALADAAMLDRLSEWDEMAALLQE